MYTDAMHTKDLHGSLVCQGCSVRAGKLWELGASPPGVRRTAKRLGVYLVNSLGKGLQWTFIMFRLPSTCRASLLYGRKV